MNPETITPQGSEERQQPPPLSPQPDIKESRLQTGVSRRPYFIPKILIFLFYLLLTIDIAHSIYSQAVAQACDKSDLAAKPLFVAAIDGFIYLLFLTISGFILYKTQKIAVLILDFFLMFIFLIMAFFIVAVILGVMGVSHCGLGPF